MSSDSHDSLSVLAHPRARIDAVELVPFRAAIQAGVKAIMSAHILFTALDADRPATLSRAILHDFLRGELGFGGLVLTDAMDMAPVARYGGLESARMALEAGVDLVLMAHQPNQLEIARQLRPHACPDALARIQGARQGADRALPDLSIIGCAAHQQIAQTIADRAITLVHDNGQLPMRPAADDLIAVVTVKPLDLTPADTSSKVTIDLAGAVQLRHPRVLALELPYGASTGDISAIAKATRDASTVIIGTITAENDPAQAALVRTIHARGQRLVVASLRTPYDIVAFPKIDTYLCAYGIRAVTMEALARVLFGEIKPTGILPCAIPEVL